MANKKDVPKDHIKKGVLSTSIAPTHRPVLLPKHYYD